MGGCSRDRTLCQFFLGIWSNLTLTMSWVSFCLLILFTIFPVSAMTSHQSCEPPDPRMNATHEIFRGQDVIWQIPPNPRSVLFLAHGSEQNNFMFFDRGVGCSQCYGLPESRDAVLDALDQGYAVLTLYCPGRNWTEWPREIAVDLVKTWTRQHSLEDLPLLGWGHSAGGFLMSYIAHELPFRALVLMCSQGDMDSLNVATPDKFPPTFFAYMNNTNEDSEANVTNIDDVALAKAKLVERGVPICEKRLFPKPVTTSLFAKRIHCITDRKAETIYGALKADGSWLDEDDFLLRDPWIEDWKSVLLQGNALPYCEEFADLCLAEHVEAELKLAHGVHSFTSDANLEIFSWLESWKSSSVALAKTVRLQSTECQIPSSQF